MLHKNIALLIALLFPSFCYGMLSHPNVSLPLYVFNNEDPCQRVEIYLPLYVWDTIISIAGSKNCFHNVNRLFRVCIQYSKLLHKKRNVSKTQNRTLNAALTSLPQVTSYNLESKINLLFGSEQTAQTTVSARALDTTNAHHLPQTTAAHIPNLRTTITQPSNDSPSFINNLDHIPSTVTTRYNNHTPIESNRANGRHRIHIAAERGDIDLVKEFVLLHKVPVDMQDDKGRTPLMYAAQHGQLDMVKTLLTLKAIVNSEDHILKATPLSYAIRKKQFPIVQYLIDNGANLAHIGKFGNTLLHTATEANCDCALINYLLNKRIIPINQTNDFDETALIIACTDGCYTIAHALIQHGANVNLETDKDLPCDIAYANKRYNIVILLLNHKARHNIKNPDQVIFKAISQQDVPLLEVLITLQVPITEHMIELALRIGNPTIIELLCNAMCKG